MPRLRVSGPRFLILATCVAACSEDRQGFEAAASEQRVWTAEIAWRLGTEPQLEIRGPTASEPAEGAPLDPLTFFRLTDGRYAVADGGQGARHGIMIYDARGNYLKQLGRKGQGPGEFLQLYYWSGEYRGDSIAAFDVVQKLEIWSADGTYRRRMQLPGSMGYVYGVFGDGTVLTNNPVELRPGRNRVLTVRLYAPDGRLVRSVREMPLPDNTVYRPERPEMRARPIIAVGKAHWYLGSLEEFSISVLDTLGREVRVLRRPFARQLLTEADREELVSALVEAGKTSPEGGGKAAEDYGKKLRENAEWDEYRPFFGTILEDEGGNVWVEHYRLLYSNFMSLDPKPTAWSVFDTAGRLLGEVVMPAGFVATTITKDQVLGIYQDELGVKHVRAYELIRP